MKRSRYHIQKIYVITCDTCNEDITRPQGGEDVETLAEAKKVIEDHERIWHTT